jgi:hypothetical protein
MSTTTYFGDVVTTGNTNLVQNLTSFGVYSYFASNIVGGQNIGSASVPFGFVYASNANTSVMNTGSISAVTANVVGNVYASNTYQGGNIFSTRMNVSGTSNIASLVVSSNIGTGGANLALQGNVYISNVVTTPNLITTVLNVSSIMNVNSLVVSSSIGTGGANLKITGNAWVSNSIQSVNLYVTSMNTGTMNTITFLTSNIGVGTLVSGNAMSISGNIYVSNSVSTTNITANSSRIQTTNAVTMNSVTLFVTGSANIAQTVNTTTTNVLSISTPSGVLGINTSTGLGANVHVQGNVFASNGYTSGNLSASGTIYYNEDLKNRSIHLIPTSANAGAIQSWISATCNSASQPTQAWWSTSPAPVYGNVVTGPPGGSAYSGSVYLPDGRVLFVPANTSNVGIYNPQNSSFTSVSGTGATPGNFKGGILLPNGNVLFVPQTSNVGMFNPLSYKFSNVVTLPAGAYNGVLTSNGVVFTPSGTYSNIINYNYSTGTTSNVFSFPTGNTLSVYAWTTATTSPAFNVNKVCWSPDLGIFVGVGNGVCYSADAVNWTTSPTAYTSISAVAWSPQLSMFVATRSDGYSPWLIYSRNGINWADTGSIYASSWFSVLWIPQLSLFVGGNNGGTGQSFGYSRDGFTWSVSPGGNGTVNGLASIPHHGIQQTV